MFGDDDYFFIHFGLLRSRFGIRALGSRRGREPRYRLLLISRLIDKLNRGDDANTHTHTHRAGRAFTDNDIKFSRVAFFIGRYRFAIVSSVRLAPRASRDNPVAPNLSINSSSDVESNESGINSVILVCIPLCGGT